MQFVKIAENRYLPEEYKAKFSRKTTNYFQRETHFQHMSIMSDV